MLQKLLAILLAVSLLAGCTAAPVETTEGDTRQYTYVQGDFCYHIPAVDLPDVNAGEMNQKLYDTYETLLQEVVFGKPREELFLLGLCYEIGRKDDVVSVTVLHVRDCDLNDYGVYHFSATTGKELTDDAVFAAFGMTPEQGRMTVRNAMEAHWDRMGEVETKEDLFYLEQKEETLADSNINAVRPLIAENGELQFVGEFYSLAGADSYMYRFNQKGELIQMTCTEHN